MYAYDDSVLAGRKWGLEGLGRMKSPHWKELEFDKLEARQIDPSAGRQAESRTDALNRMGQT